MKSLMKISTARSVADSSSVIVVDELNRALEQLHQVASSLEIGTRGNDAKKIKMRYLGGRRYWVEWGYWE
jgi:hypothetical protein